MKKLSILVFTAVFLVLWACVASAGPKLPDPQTSGGMGLFDAFKLRQSAPGGDFPKGELSAQELSNVLWAMSGLNRGETGWTVPMSKGLPPYVRVYAATKDGVFLYEWDTHSLEDISDKDIRADIGAQRFVADASCILILVPDTDALAEFDEATGLEFAAVAVGMMTQDAYLACAAMNLGARYIHSMRENAIASALSIAEGNRPICVFMLGK
ncbi:MAG: nitroreductase family protein [Synergistaceae bacterium]|jgi:nitroreductase|nr:nitroreductase family protein [Synergistaceae bacterium]